MNFLVWPIIFSKRQLIRIRKQLGVNTRRNESELSNIIEANSGNILLLLHVHALKKYNGIVFFPVARLVAKFFVLNKWLATSCPSVLTQLLHYGYCTNRNAITACNWYGIKLVTFDVVMFIIINNLALSLHPQALYFTNWCHPLCLCHNQYMYTYKFQEELHGAGSSLGYRSMWMRLVHTHHLAVRRWV